MQTPEGMRSGSSVWETKSREGSGIPDRAIRSRVRGEAVAVDLPGGTVFALLRGADMNADYPSGVVYGHLYTHRQPDVPMGKDWAENVRTIAKAKPSFELYPDAYPLLVRFRDINDPASVEQVDPANLSASFGPEVSLKRITISVTDERPDFGIGKRLPWLDNQKGALVQIPPRMPMSEAPFSAEITESDFVMGDN